MKKVLCASFLTLLLTLIISVPAFATTKLWTRHISAGKIQDGKANYSSAVFERFKLSVTDDETVAEQAHLDATGKLTLSGGKYTTKSGEEVNGTSKTFDLEANMKLGKNLDYKVPTDFFGAADTGLNEVTATWTFDSMSSLNGNGTIPTFVSTADQVKSGVVPYIELTYDSSKKITAVKWAIVKASDTSTPVAVDYNSRIVINAETRDEETITLMSKTDFASGTTLSGTINLDEALSESDLEHISVSLRNRANAPYTFAHEWRFFTSPYPDIFDGTDDKSQDEHTKEEDTSENKTTTPSSSGGGCNAAGFMSIFALLGVAVLLKKR